jgi:hypothetical protein
MTQAHLAKLWGWLAVASILFLVTTVISLQGGTDFVGRLFGEKADLSVDKAQGIAYFAAIVGGGLYFLASFPFLLHALRHGNDWAERTPVVWLDGLKTNDWAAKVYQGCVLLVLVLAPAVGIVKCQIEAETGDICEQDTTNIYRGHDTNLFSAPIAKNGNQMRLRKADSGGDPCKSGVELFPRSLTPLFFYLIPLVGLAITFAGFVLLFVPRSNKPVEAKDIT